MTTILVELPLPLRELSSNGNKGSWRKKAAATKEYRREIQWLTNNRLEAAQRVRIHLTFCIKGGRLVRRYQPRDAANALSAFKAGIDGLVDAGMCPDDSAKHLELGAILIDSTRGPFVEVSIEVIE